MVGNVSPVFLGIAKAVFIVVPLMLIGQFGKYHNTLCLSPQILHKHCSSFLMGLTRVPRENKNNAYAKFGGTNKEYYGIFRSSLWQLLQKSTPVVRRKVLFFFRRRKSFTVEENHFKILRHLCKWYRRKPHVPCHSNKVLRSWLRGTQKLINSS